MLLRTLSFQIQNYKPQSLISSTDASILVYADYVYVDGGFGVGPQYPVVDYYVLDLTTGARRSITEINPAFTGPDKSDMKISGDGKKLAFVFGPQEEIIVLDIATGKVEYASNSSDSIEQNLPSFSPELSADGRYLAFQSFASNLVAGDSNGVADIFVRDLVAGTTVRITNGANGASSPVMSADGKTVVYHQDGQVYAKDLSSGSLKVVSADSEGRAVTGFLYASEMSADGRYVVFVAHDGRAYQGYCKDLASGSLEKIMDSGYFGSPAFSHIDAEISGDGNLVSYIAVRSETHSLPEYHPAIQDMAAGAISALGGPSGNFYAYREAELSPDGRHYSTVELLGTTSDIKVSTFLQNGSLAPGAGNQIIEGGRDVDTIVYPGTRAEYQYANGFIADNHAARNGVDQLIAIDRIHFDDSALAFDVAGAAGQALRLYQASFARAPDPAGAGFWIAALDHGQSLKAVAAGFVASSEFQAFLATVPGNELLLRALYQNILGRPGDQEGMAFWTRALDSSDASVADVLVGFSESRELVQLIGAQADGIAFIPYG